MFDRITTDPPPGEITGQKIPYAFKFQNGKTVFTKLLVKRLPKDVKTVVKCIGKSCKFVGKDDKRKRVFKDEKKVKIQPLLKGKKLKNGAEIEIKMTKPDHIGAYVKFVIRKGKKKQAPKVKTKCLPVGSNKPKKKC